MHQPFCPFSTSLYVFTNQAFSLALLAGAQEEMLLEHSARFSGDLLAPEKLPLNSCLEEIYMFKE
jgi:hypothetical protein